jgi:hypothetical protein
MPSTFQLVWSMISVVIFHPNPFWLELALTILIALAIIVPGSLRQRKICAKITSADSEGNLDEWMRKNWRTVVVWGDIEILVIGPCLEELEYRALPILILQTGHPLLAISIGLAANIHFALGHKGYLKTGGQDTKPHRVDAFIGGCLLLASGLISGLLIVPILWHMFFNISLRRIRQDYDMLKNRTEPPMGHPYSLRANGRDYYGTF